MGAKHMNLVQFRDPFVWSISKDQQWPQWDPQSGVHLFVSDQIAFEVTPDFSYNYLPNPHQINPQEPTQLCQCNPRFARVESFCRTQTQLASDGKNHLPTHSFIKQEKNWTYAHK